MNARGHSPAPALPPLFLCTLLILGDDELKFIHKAEKFAQCDLLQNACLRIEPLVCGNYEAAFTVPMQQPRPLLLLLLLRTTILALWAHPEMLRGQEQVSLTMTR